jgi:hypothetical protein
VKALRLKAADVQALKTEGALVLRLPLTRCNSTATGIKDRALWDRLDFQSPRIYRDGDPRGATVMGCGEYLHVPVRLEPGETEPDTVHRVRCDLAPGDRLAVRLTGLVVEVVAVRAERVEGVWLWVVEVRVVAEGLTEAEARKEASDA